jgi:hypothetical protein
MTTQADAHALPVILIVDYSAGMWPHLAAIEHHVRALLDTLDREAPESGLDMRLLGMGGKTIAVPPATILRGQSGTLARAFAVCNLERSLQQVAQTLEGRTTHFRIKGEVVLFIGNRPVSPQWEIHVQRLNTLGVNLSPIAFSFLSDALTEDLVKRMRAGSGQPMRLEVPPSGDSLSWIFKDFILKRIQVALKSQLTSAEGQAVARVQRHEEVRRGTPSQEPRPEQPAPSGAPPAAPDDGATGSSTRRIPVKVRGRDLSPTSESARPAGAGQDEGVMAVVAVGEPWPLDQQQVTSGDWRLLATSRHSPAAAPSPPNPCDVFRIAEADGWLLAALSNGLGPADEATAHATLAVERAIVVLERWVRSLSGAKLPTEKTHETALRKAFEETWKTLNEAIQNRQATGQRPGATLLCLIVKPGEDSLVVGSLCVGGGAVAVRWRDGSFEYLNLDRPQPTTSPEASLTARHWKEWLDHVIVRRFETAPQVVLAADPGMARTFMANEAQSARLAQVLAAPGPAEAILSALFMESGRPASVATGTLLLAHTLAQG